MHSRITLSLLFASVCVAPGLVAQRNVSGGPLHPKQACFDVMSYELTLRVLPDEKSINGSLVMAAKALKETDAVLLDLENKLKVESVTSDGKPAKFRHEKGRIHVDLPRRLETGDLFTVTVNYGGRPRVAPRPPWDGGFTWARTPSGAHWIATTCQMNGADVWWPCKDHPSDKPEKMDLRITVPAGLYCAANGTLVEPNADDPKPPRGWRSFHWHVSVPISNYCIALNIAPYEVLEREYVSVTGEKMRTFFYALPENVEKARKAFPHFLDHLKFMEEVCGPYPFRRDKYAVVETPHLGMEHQTIIAYGNGYRVSEDGYDWLHHHEMAHEWWANLVTCRDWKDMWIHEGIGTYMQALYLEKLRGRRGYLRAMRGKRPQPRATVAPREVTDSMEIYRTGRHDVYNKGSWVMHTLRWLMEDEKFFVALRRMAYPDPKMEKVTDGSCVRLTDTEEIRRIAEKYHGADLGWFFEVYLRQPELPRIKSSREAGKLLLEWEVPVDVEFPMPVPVMVNNELIRVPMPKGRGVLEVAEDADVRIDPDMLVLRRTRGSRRRR